MILNILIATLLIGFIALVLYVNYLDNCVKAMFEEIYEINGDIDQIDEFIFSKVINSKKK